jgi:TrmH family RNA methyltransferase
LYTSLPDFLAQQHLPIYAAVLGGHSVYEQTLASPAIFLLGSEAHGISAEVLSYAQHHISIPSAVSGQAESLNVATATAILLSEFHRRQRPTQK